MTATPEPQIDTPEETPEQRAARIALKQRVIAEAKAEAGRVGTIPAEEVHEWVRSLGTANPLPMPKPRR